MPDVDLVSQPAKPNPRNNGTMFKIFQNVQYNVVQHKKYVKEMKKLYKKLDEDTFRESFRNALHYLFSFGDTSSNVDRVIQFVATFCTSLDDEEEFLLFIFEIIFDCQCVLGQSVRYRASQLLAAVLSALGDDASLDDDLCDKLLASQMQRLQDTRGAVRCRAALALQRLQNPMEPDDEVTRAYRFHMSCDPSSSVRRAVVMSIAKCTRNVPFVLERLCDVDEAVRRAAFLYISAINVTQLRVRQRILTLKVGLTERSPRVRRVVEEILIPGWLSTFKGNIIDLLKAIRLDNAHDAKDSQHVAGKLLQSLFKRLPISELLEWLPTDRTLRLIPAEKLNKETAWYWRHLAEHLQAIDDDETLETVVPDLVVLTGYIKAIVEAPCPSETEDPAGFSTRQNVLHELASLLHVYDAGDQAGRSALQQLITEVLTGDYGPLNPDVVRAFVASLEMVIPEVTPRMEVIVGIISELREPPEEDTPPPVVAQVESTELKLQRARLRVSLNVAMEAQEEAVKEENYALAEECKAKVKDIQAKLDELNVRPAPSPPPVLTTIKEKLSDAITLNKCLYILNCALDTPQLPTITPMLRMIFNELEVEIFQNPEILESALETVALYGMLDKAFAEENKAFFFANLIDISNERVVTIVLKGIVDLLCVHGAKVFEEDNVTQNGSRVSTKRKLTYNVFDDDGSLSESAISLTPNNSTVIELLLKIMDSTCATYRLIIAEGLCRLLYLGHLESASILSRLLLLWFNPATVDEDKLRQTVGVFFQSFASNVEGAQEQIQKATIPTLRALANAPSSSPISEIDQEAVVKFIVSLTRVNHELTDSQGAMAMQVCSQLCRKPTSNEAGLLCRLLALLSPPRDAAIAIDLAAMLRDTCSKITDKQSCRNLTRYLGALEAFERLTMNKMSNTDLTEGTLQPDDSLIGKIGRSTSSLPHPVARSTHVVVNETVKEEVEIDETSPTGSSSRITEARKTKSTERTSSQSSQPRTSTESLTSQKSDQIESEENKQCEKENRLESDSSDVSPVKKAKVVKGKKKKLSLNRDENRGSGSDVPKKATKGKNKKADQKNTEEKTTGIKRTRSQRSIEDVDRANKGKIEEPVMSDSPPKLDLDSTNITVRRSTRAGLSLSSIDLDVSDRNSGSDNIDKAVQVPSKTKTGAAKKAPAKQTKKRKSIESKKSISPRKSTGSVRSLRSSQGSIFDDSADETELHTIVYEQELVQSLLDDSSELLDGKSPLKDPSRRNITIPETPEGSDESDSEVEIPVEQPKGKRNTKKK